jgi:hypothetical protein
MQQLALDIDDEALAQDLREAEGNVDALSALDLADPSASLAHDVNQPLAAIVASAYACSQWLSADPPNIERAKMAAARIIRDANAATEIVARLRRKRRLHTTDELKGTNGRD